MKSSDLQSFCRKIKMKYKQNFYVCAFDYPFYCTCFILQKYIWLLRVGFCSPSSYSPLLTSCSLHYDVWCKGGDDVTTLRWLWLSTSSHVDFNSAADLLVSLPFFLSSITYLYISSCCLFTFDNCLLMLFHSCLGLC